MGKTTRAHVKEGLCEKRDYQILSEDPTRDLRNTRYIVICPFCHKEQNMAVTSERGTGVRCNCGAMFHKGYCYLHKFRNVHKVHKPTIKERYLPIRVRCPIEGRYIPAKGCQKCEYYKGLEELDLATWLKCNYQGRAR